MIPGRRLRPKNGNAGHPVPPAGQGPGRPWGLLPGNEDLLEIRTARNLAVFYALLDAREEMRGHSRLVASYALLIAETLGVRNMTFLRDLEIGAMLHDIGKIAVPRRILLKPAFLDPGERVIIMEHPLIGFELLQEFPSLARAAEVVLYHHERYDGRGYPCGLSGGEIPLPARIFSVADTLDVITSDRPYRGAKDFVAARKEIRKNRGTQFDPDVVEAMLSLPLKMLLRIRRDFLGNLKPATIH